MTKREVPTALRALMDVDVQATNAFCSFCEKFMPLRSLRIHYKVLELSCHGLPWLVGWLVFIWLAGKPSWYEMQVNLYIGLVLDLIIVGLIKAFVRRRRPVENNKDMLMTVGPDVYSFPSGHATRATFLAFYFLSIWPVPLLMRPPFFAWVTSVCISRVLLRRHHLLDVLAGVIVGLLEGLLINLLWLDHQWSAWIVASITDDGSDTEYHV